jgi:hypothetical protein
MCDDVGAKFFRAQTDLLWGRMLGERGAPEDARAARELLERAHDGAVVRGYGAVRERAQAALDRLD